jgi:hypothetical protein
MTGSRTFRPANPALSPNLETTTNTEPQRRFVLPPDPKVCAGRCRRQGPTAPCGVDLRSSLDPNTSTRRAHQPGGRPPGNGQNQTPASRLDQPRSFRDDLQEQPSAGPTLSIFVHGQTGELDSLAFLQDSQWP